MLVRFWGVRGSIPTPGPGTVHFGGNTPCVEVRAGGEIIILDSGTGIRQLGAALSSEFNGKPLHLTILITHTHWDHIQGFPFFKPAYNPKNQIQLLGYEGAKKGLASVLSQQMESPYFPIELKRLPGNILIKELKQMAFKIGAVNVKAELANHPGVCVGYRLESADGSLAYLPDNEPFQRRHQLQRQSTPKKKPGATEFARAADQKLVEFVRGVDLLILDAQYDSQEYRQHVGWGHGCAEDAVNLAIRAGVRQLSLFHHDPEHDDNAIRRIVEDARKAALVGKHRLQIDAAREGDTWESPR